MIALTAVITFRPEDAEELLRVYTELAQAVLDEEPGCLIYQVHQATARHDQVFIYEVYRDQQSLETHRHTSHYLQMRERVANRILQSELTLWQPTGPSRFPS